MRATEYLGGSPKPHQDVDQQPRKYTPTTVETALTPFPRKSHRLPLLMLREAASPKASTHLQSPGIDPSLLYSFILFH
ncbi:hypothetical protein BH18ACI4_BH18ACI4_17960 [soil metagenome]